MTDKLLKKMTMCQQRVKTVIHSIGGPEFNPMLEKTLNFQNYQSPVAVPLLSKRKIPHMGKCTTCCGMEKLSIILLCYFL